MDIKLVSDDEDTIEINVIKEVVRNVLKELETKEYVAVLEEDLKKEIGLPEDDIFLLGRIQKYIKGSGLSVVTKHNSKQHNGKRMFVFYDTKPRFVVYDIDE